MANVDNQIQQLVDAFTRDLAEVVGNAIDGAVQEALGRSRRAAGGGAAARPARAARPRGKAAKAAKAPKAAAAPGRPSKKGKKTKGGWYRRSGEQIVELEKRFLAEVKARPGRRIEEIGKSMKESTKTLQLPVRKLISDKKVKTKGQKRATRYFPG